MRARVLVEAGVGRLMVHSMAQTAIRSPVNIRVKEGKVAVSFLLHCELNVLMDTVQVVSLPGPCGQMRACCQCNGTSTGIYGQPSRVPSP
jgi:hypothetical protein